MVCLASMQIRIMRFHEYHPRTRVMSKIPCLSPLPAPNTQALLHQPGLQATSSFGKPLTQRWWSLCKCLLKNSLPSLPKIACHSFTTKSCPTHIDYHTQSPTQRNIWKKKTTPPKNGKEHQSEAKPHKPLSFRWIPSITVFFAKLPKKHLDAVQVEPRVDMCL